MSRYLVRPMVALELGDSLGSPSAPRIGGDVFRYRLHSPDGDDLGEATYAIMIKAGEEIVAGSNERFRVVDVVRFEEEDDAPLVRLLKIEAFRGCA